MGAGIWWLASYPRSGNTWLRTIIATLVLNRPANINVMAFLGQHAGDRFSFDGALGIDSVSLAREQETNLRPRAYEIWAAEAVRPLYCKAHDAYHLTPAGEPLFPAATTRGAVYIVRDPRAVAVSSAHFRARPLDETIAEMDDPAAMSGSSTTRLSHHLCQRLLRWGNHIESWLAAPFPVHLLRYEDILTDPHAAIGRMAAFLGLPSDCDAIAAAVEATTFLRLQTQEREAGFVQKPRTATAFFREGKADGWRGALTPEQAARIVAAHGAVMRQHGYEVTLAPFATERGSAGAVV
jgi:aryl sulfotransferase